MIHRTNLRLGLLALAAGLALTAAAPVAAEGVIKGGTVIITPGATVEGLGNIRPGTDGATIAVDCPGGQSFTLSAGNVAGSCSAKTDDSGDVESARCDDGGGNAAVAVCALDEGKGACSVTIGKGMCQAE